MADKRLIIPAAVLEDYQLGPAQKIIYSVMLVNADEDGVCRLSSSQLGRIAGMTNVAASGNRLKLCRLGYAELVHGTNHNYRLLKHTEAL